MSTGVELPGKTAPHLASPIDALYIGMLLEERHEGAMVSNLLENGALFNFMPQ